ncbi:alpha/beta hydrolase [uncultured Maribacter sp.]|uniref:alpha/beta hydrolase n=1 Tax=uncultured Maribacter sp. TaxID=431308 RepID=UPI0026164DFC|nr:alpha/beta hydrolase [uncultured Maribacter sp.]
MKIIRVLLLFVLTWNVGAQEIRLKKGVIMTNLKVHDTLAESFSLYLPSSFNTNKAWPVLFVFNMKNKGKQALSMFVSAAEEQEYILAASNNVNDSLSLTKNLLISSRMFNRVYSILPIKKERVYTAGYKEGGKFASLIPAFIKGVSGVLSLSASVANREVLDVKKPYYFIGIVGKEDYSYSDMINNRKFLNKLKYPNQLLFHGRGEEWPQSTYFNSALEYFKLSAMAKNKEELDTFFVRETYQKNLMRINTLLKENKPLLAENILSQMLDVYRPLMNIDSVKEKRKYVKRSKLYRSRKNEENGILLKESFAIDDYNYFLEEDIASYNYNNLGWWKYQMEQITKLGNSSKLGEKQLGKRLDGYLNALLEDYIDLIKGADLVDEEALNLVYMIKTVVSPKEYKNYLNIISISAKNEDYGTALFYLEELLMNGYRNKEELYKLEHTALLRITPEFNETVAKYLKEARYEIMEE